MLLFGAFSAVVKGKTTFDVDGTKGGLPTRRDGGPDWYKSVPHREAWASLEVSCIFVHDKVCNRRR